MNPNSPLVSVLIPVYGVEKYITRCLESVANQTYDNIEVILVNDCTPDRSVEVAEEYIKKSSLAGKTRIINHEKNRGLSAARNTAVAAAKGEFVLHLDSDDFILEKTIEESLKAAISNKADAVLFGFTHKYKGLEIIERVNVQVEKTEYLKSIIERRNVVCLCGGLYNRHLYENGVEELEGYDYEEDFVTKPRLLFYANRIIGIDEPFYVYSHEGEDSMSRHFKVKCVEDCVVTIQTLCDFFASVDNGHLYERSLIVAQQKLKANLLRQWCLCNGTKEDLSFILKAFEDSKPMKELGMKDYLSILLSNHKMYGLLKYYNRGGNKLMSTIKKWRLYR